MRAAIISLGSVSSKMTFEAMQKHFETVDHLNLKNIEVNLGKDPHVLYEGKPLKEYDCVFAKGSFRYVPLLRSLATVLQGKCYLPLNPSCYTIGHDKLITQLKLQQDNIPMPTTYVTSTESSKELLEKISYPIVMKFPSGTQGKGVMFADSYSSASSMLDALATLKQPFLIQEYVECDESDIRAFVVGDKVIAAMKRKAVRGEKRANIHTGGVGEKYELDNFSKKIAIKTAKAIGADICGVDILESVKGPLVIEVNVSPGLQGITEATKINIADKIAKHLANQTEEYIKSKTKSGSTQMMSELGIEGTELKKQLTTQLDLRGDRILLPKVMTDISKFDETQDVVISAKKGELHIEKFEMKKK